MLECSSGLSNCFSEQLPHACEMCVFVVFSLSLFSFCLDCVMYESVCASFKRSSKKLIVAALCGSGTRGLLKKEREIRPRKFRVREREKSKSGVKKREAVKKNKKTSRGKPLIRNLTSSDPSFGMHEQILETRVHVARKNVDSRE